MILRVLCIMVGLKDTSVNVRTSHRSKRFDTLPELGQKHASVLLEEPSNAFIF